MSINKTITPFIIFLILSCTHYQETFLTTINQSKLGSECGNGILINSPLQIDSLINRQMEQYVYKCFIDYEKCNTEDYSSLFSSDVFQDYSKYLFSDTNFYNSSIYESNDMWIEGYTNVLLFITDTSIKYSIINDIIKVKLPKSMEHILPSSILYSVWNDKELDNLLNMKDLESIIRNKYDLLLFKAYLHNHNLKNGDVDDKLRHYQDITEENAKLKALMSESKFIELGDFVEEVMGGW